MKNVLVVWCEIPESTSLITLSVSDKDFKKLKSFHNHFVNSGEEKVSDAIYKFFFNKDHTFKYEKSEDLLENVNYDLVIMTGFMM